MKKPLMLIAIMLFCFWVNPEQPATASEVIVEESYFPIYSSVAISHELKITLGETTFLDLTTPPKTTYYVKVGNTISKLEDSQGYIIAAKRLGMETIMIVPHKKVYKTVSLDLDKSDEEMKDAIEVKLDEIIVK